MSAALHLSGACAGRYVSKVTEATLVRAKVSIVLYDAETKLAHYSRGQRRPLYARFMAMSALTGTVGKANAVRRPQPGSGIAGPRTRTPARAER